jgi:hypothetical protein
MGYLTDLAISPCTVNLEMGLTKRMFNKAIIWNWIDKNPVAKIKMMTDVYEEVHCLTHEEEVKLLTACFTLLREIVFVALETWSVSLFKIRGIACSCDIDSKYRGACPMSVRIPDRTEWVRITTPMNRDRIRLLRRQII